MPFWDPTRAMRTFGLPERIVMAKPAQVVFPIYSARATIIGTAMWISYLRGHLQTVDMLMGLNFYGAFVDAYISWREGKVGNAWFRGSVGVFIGVWGLLNLTAGGQLW
jgi:hypothetical protein